VKTLDAGLGHVRIAALLSFLSENN
jgi:hypothetical protein